MGKAVYEGVGGVARKAKNIYEGISGVARKIKAGWIGVGGIARQFFTSGFTVYDRGYNPLGLVSNNDQVTLSSDCIAVSDGYDYHESKDSYRIVYAGGDFRDILECTSVSLTYSGAFSKNYAFLLLGWSSSGKVSSINQNMLIASFGSASAINNSDGTITLATSVSPQLDSTNYDTYTAEYGNPFIYLQDYYYLQFSDDEGYEYFCRQKAHNIYQIILE